MWRKRSPGWMVRCRRRKPGNRSGRDPSDAVGPGQGEGAAAEFCGFIKLFRSLPDPKVLLAAPETAEVPEDPATLYAVCDLLFTQTKTRAKSPMACSGADFGRKGAYRQSYH